MIAKKGFVIAVVLTALVLGVRHAELRSAAHVESDITLTREDREKVVRQAVDAALTFYLQEHGHPAHEVTVRALTGTDTPGEVVTANGTVQLDTGVSDLRCTLRPNGGRYLLLEVGTSLGLPFPLDDPARSRLYP